MDCTLTVEALTATSDGNSARQRQENRNSRRSADTYQRERDEKREALHRDRDRAHSERVRREADDRSEARRRWDQERKDRLDARADDLRRHDEHARNILMWLRSQHNDGSAQVNVQVLQQLQQMQQQNFQMRQQNIEMRLENTA